MWDEKEFKAERQAEKIDKLYVLAHELKDRITETNNKIEKMAELLNRLSTKD